MGHLHVSWPRSYALATSVLMTRMRKPLPCFPEEVSLYIFKQACALGDVTLPEIIQ